MRRTARTSSPSTKRRAKGLSTTTSAICESMDSAGNAREMPEYRLTITVSEHGSAPENGERFLNGFMREHPEVGPSVAQNVATGTLSVTFIVDASGGKDAMERGLKIFCD